MSDDRKAEIAKAFDAAEARAARAKTLRKDVANTSSHESRTWQTMNHLAGKAEGDAADASIRHRENVKESMAEDDEEGARKLREKAAASIRALRRK